MLDGQKGAIAAALITGDRAAVSDDTAEALRRAGLAHLLAISGLHMGLVAGFVFTITSIVFAAIPQIGNRYDGRKAAALFGLAAGFGYLVMSGASAPTQRAFIMISIIFAAVLFNRRALSLRTISLAALIIAVLAPEHVVSPGFLLSFSATLGLIAFYEWARLHLILFRPVENQTDGIIAKIIQKTGMVLFAMVMTSLVAGLATSPFAAWFFNRTAVYGVLANALAMPLFTFLVMPFLLIGTALDVVGWGTPFYMIAGFGLDCIIDIAHTVSALPGAVLSMPSAPAHVLFILAVGFLWLCLGKGMLRVGGLLIMLLGYVLWMLGPVPQGWLGPNGGALVIRQSGTAAQVAGFGQVSNFDLAVFAGRVGIDPSRIYKMDRKSQGDCDAAGCSVRFSDGRLIVINKDAAAFATDCVLADIVISWHPISARTASMCNHTDWLSGAGIRAAELYLEKEPHLKYLPVRKRLWSQPDSKGWQFAKKN